MYLKLVILLDGTLVLQWYVLVPNCSSDIVRIGHSKMVLGIKIPELYHYGQELNTIIFWPTLTISLSYFAFLFHDAIFYLLLSLL